MSSTTLPPAGVTVPQLVARASALVEAAREFSRILAEDPSLLAEVPDETLETLALQLHAARDAVTASATVVTGRVDRFIGSVKGKLVAGKYLSTSQFLVAEAGMAPVEARAIVGRGRMLQRDYAVVADAWLSGEVPGGAIRALTRGVEEVHDRSQRRPSPASRAELLAQLIPIAAAGDLSGLEVEVRLQRLAADPDGCDEAALFAFERQTLSIVEQGPVFRITGTLTPEAAAATKTVLEAAAAQIATEQLGDLTHEDDCRILLIPGEGCTCGELDRARRAAGLQHDQLLARALGEVMTDRHDNGDLGSHHGSPRQVTLVADVTDAAAPLIGRLAMPGQDDDVLLPPATMSRLLCDADVTRVLTTQASVPAADAAQADAAGREAGYLRAVVDSLTVMARSVLYVGRSERTVSARLRKALIARDGHCVFPGCRAHARRCEGHHVIPWENGGATELPNMALLCVRHHHAVHEGGWTMTLKPGYTGHETGCWDFTPPPLRRRRLQP